MKINSIAVFCGSKSGNNKIFVEHANEIGAILAKENVKLIYGGGNKGLMGTVANACLENGGNVTGIIPKLLTDFEQQHNELSELIVTNDMHSRKQLLYGRSDAAIILPGGHGTLDELFEMLTWNALAIHDKRVFLMNSNGFYTHLIAHLIQMHKEDFLYHRPEDQITVLNDPKEIIPFLRD